MKGIQIVIIGEHIGNLRRKRGAAVAVGSLAAAAFVCVFGREEQIRFFRDFEVLCAENLVEIAADRAEVAVLTGETALQVHICGQQALQCGKCVYQPIGSTGIRKIGNGED